MVRKQLQQKPKDADKTIKNLSTADAELIRAPLLSLGTSLAASLTSIGASIALSALR